MTFEVGQSGNPAGRPKGTGSRQKIFNDLVMPRKEELIKKSIDMALDGDQQMLKLLIERILPAKPIDEPIPLGFPTEVTIETAIEMTKGTIRLINQEEITPEQAKTLFSIIQSFQDGILMLELGRRMDRIEASMGMTGIHPEP